MLYIYVLTYNAPRQLEIILNQLSPLRYEIQHSLYVVDNSNMKTHVEHNSHICQMFDSHHLLCGGNIGISQARYFVSDHFCSTNDGDYCLYFQDDMLPNYRYSLCRNGLPTQIPPDFLSKCTNIMRSESLDFLKLSFTELYGDNTVQYAWYNMSYDDRTHFFKNEGHPPRTKIRYMGTMDGLSYAVGDIFFCDWPHLITCSGNQTIFVDPRHKHSSESERMKNVYILIQQSKLKAGVLLGSYINHQRIFDYERSTRKE